MIGSRCQSATCIDSPRILARVSLTAVGQLLLSGQSGSWTATCSRRLRRTGGWVAEPEDVAAQYERLLAIERDRRRKVEQLEPLLATIADALDVREIFPKLSAVIQPVIPHATVSLALLTPDGQGVKVRVASNYDVEELPVYRFTDAQEAIGAGWRSFIGYDCTVLEEGVTRIQTSPPGVEPLAFVDL